MQRWIPRGWGLTRADCWSRSEKHPGKPSRRAKRDWSNDLRILPAKGRLWLPLGGLGVPRTATSIGSNRNAPTLSYHKCSNFEPSLAAHTEQVSPNTGLCSHSRRPLEHFITGSAQAGAWRQRSGPPDGWKVFFMMVCADLSQKLRGNAHCVHFGVNRSCRTSLILFGDLLGWNSWLSRGFATHTTPMCGVCSTSLQSPWSPI